MSRTLKISLLVISLSVILLLGYQLYSLNEAEKLWGYRPLFFLVALWTFIIALFEPKFTKHPKGIKLLGLSTLSGILLTLGFPNVPLTPLMFVGFVPLLLIERDISAWRTETSKWEVFKYSYHAFVVWNILTTYWVMNTSFAPSVFAILVNSLLMSIPMVLFHQTKKTLNNKLAYASFVAYWISFEYFHMRWELSWTWLTLGNSFAEFPSWIQWYEFTGVFGGTLWILLVNVLVYKILALHWDQKQPLSIRPFIKPLALIIIPILISVIWYYNETDEGVLQEVVVIQPNFEPHYEKFSIRKSLALDRFIKLSQEQVTDSTDYLVFPETSFGRINLERLLANPPIRSLKKYIDRYNDLKLVSGVSAYRFLKEGEAHTRSTRTMERNNKKTYWEAYNAAIQIKSGENDTQEYIKSILVPGAEIFPYSDLFFFMKPLVDMLDGSVAGHGIQEERSVFSGGNLSIAPVICYESVYGEYTTGYIRKGANAIFVVTNDGWWDNTAGHVQHLKFARLRAIETRRSVARSANTGVSAFINQRGDISHATEYGVEAAVKSSIAFNDEITFYVRWGDMIGRLSCFLAILLILNTFVKGRIARGSKAESKKAT